MDLTDAFKNKLIGCINDLSEKKFITIAEKVGFPTEKEAAKEFLHEDYSWVMSFVEAIGITKVEADIWCENCEREVTTTVGVDSYEYVCPSCGLSGRA